MLSNRVQKLRKPVIAPLFAKIWRFKTQGIKIYDFAAGQPGFQPPIEVRKYISEVLMKDFPQLHRYSSVEGIYELREEMSKELEEKFGFNVDPEKQIIITTGGEEALYTALLSLLNKDDEVILFDPTFLEYEAMVDLVGGRPVFVKTDESRGYQPDIEDLKSKITRKTKVLILTTPDNPTGRIIGYDEAKAIADLAEDYGFWVLSDETYRYLIYEGEHLGMYRFSNIHDRLGIVGSFSKEAGLAGWRIGYTYGSEELIKAMVKVKEYITLNAPTISQYAVLYFLKEKLAEKYTKYIVEEYRKRREKLYESMRTHLPEAIPFKPQATFYMFVNMKRYMEKVGVHSSIEFSEYLLEKVKIATIPGEVCGPNSKYHVRFSFSLITINEIDEAMEKLRKHYELL